MEVDIFLEKIIKSLLNPFLRDDKMKKSDITLGDKIWEKHLITMDLL